MKRIFSGLMALILVVTIGLTGCSNAPSSLTGNYAQDTLALVQTLRTTIDLPEGSKETTAAQTSARQIINDFASYYRRDNSVSSSSSFTTMRTALNAIAGHYLNYPNRPLPEKLKARVEQELKQVEQALKREA
jgi:photosystem II Psb27 protein